MKIAIAGGGIVGLTLARLLRARGFEPHVFERMPGGVYIKRGYMMGFHAYPPLEELGILDDLRPQGRDIAPGGGGGDAVAICIEVGKLIHALADGLPVDYETTVTGLTRDDSGRIVGVTVQGPAEGAAPAAAPGEGDYGSRKEAQVVGGVRKDETPAGGGGEVREIEADLVVACDGMNSPVRNMAGMEAEYTPLSEASLSFMSPTPGSVSFAMAYMSDHSHIGTLSWPEGSAGWRTCEKVGAEAALAPGVEAVKEMWARLLPEAAQAVSGVTSIDQVRYSEPQLLTTPKWWIPGLILIGDSAHFFGPETGVSSGVGMADAHALAEAVRQNPEDPDAACRAFESWRAPVVRPLEAMDPGRQRLMITESAARDDEVWPPRTAA